MVAYICTLLLLCFFQRVSGDNEEPKCFSRFDYDEKMLMKVLRFEDKLQKFEEFIKESKANQKQDKAERENKFISEIDEFKTQMIEEIARQRNLSEEIVGFLDEAKAKLNASLVKHEQSQKEFDDKLKKFEDIIKVSTANQEQEKAERENIFKSEIDEFKKQMTEEISKQRNLEKVVAFTVTNPSDSSTFTTVVTNEGVAFDTSTGKFTCPTSGLYYFTLNIIKKRSPGVDAVGCYISLNGNTKVRAYIDPQDGATGADNGSYGVTNAVNLRLNIGDVVTLTSCNTASYMESWSSFSGFLVRADV